MGCIITGVFLLGGRCERVFRYVMLNDILEGDLKKKEKKISINRKCV